MSVCLLMAYSATAVRAASSRPILNEHIVGLIEADIDE